MRSHSHRGLAPGSSWRALLLALGLGLPAAAAEPEKPRPPEDLTKGLVLATLETSGDDQKTVKPRLVYRRGSWEPVAEPVTGPSHTGCSPPALAPAGTSCGRPGRTA